MSRNKLILSPKKTAEMLNLSDEELPYYAEHDPDFPKKVVINGRDLGWYEEDVIKFLREPTTKPIQ